MNIPVKMKDGISQVWTKSIGEWNLDTEENFKVVVSYDDGKHIVSYDGEFVSLSKAKSYVNRKRLWGKDFCISITVEWWKPDTDDIVNVIVREMIPEVLETNRILKNIM